MYASCRKASLWVLVIMYSTSSTLSGKHKIKPHYHEFINDNDNSKVTLSASGIISLLKKKVRAVKVTEYMHIPKCGTLIYRNVCEKKGMLTCLEKTVLLNRKCGLIGEHCDWLSKYNCHRKTSACRSGRPKGSGWSKGMCSKADNYTAWLLDDNNWAHNLMTRMLYGRKVHGNGCRIPERKEHNFWRHELRQEQYLGNRRGSMIEKINISPHVLKRARTNLIEHFLLWAPQSEMEEFFCVLRQLLGRRNTWQINMVIKGRKTSYSKTPSESALYSEYNNRLALELNQLDNELYEWSVQYWNMIKVEYPSSSSVADLRAVKSPRCFAELFFADALLLLCPKQVAAMTFIDRAESYMSSKATSTSYHLR
ncbi:unnamed protein product [Bathycoccus prasinos]